MYKLCLLVAFHACASDGWRIKRVKESPDQGASSQDVQGHKPMEQMSTRAGSRSHGQANWRKVAPLLLTFFAPAAGFVPSSTGLASNSHISGNTSVAPHYSNTQAPILMNPTGARVHVMMLDQNDVEEAPTVSGGPTVRAVVSVDWEGIDLRMENLRAFEAFCEAHPEVPLTNFLNAAYFTRSGAQSVDDEWSPIQVVRPIDENGLHLHAWKSLVEDSGVQYLSGPEYVLSPGELAKSLEFEKKLAKKLEKIAEGVSISLPEEFQSKEELESYLNRDVGLENDIRAYTVEELRAILSNSRAILEKKGLKVGKSFRAGAWLAGPNVLEAIRHEGFLVNSSAVDFDAMMAKMAERSPSKKPYYAGKPLPSMLRELWPGISDQSQPYLTETPAGWLFQMPNTGGLADYTTVEDMVDHISDAVEQLDAEDAEDRFVHIGFHQETASTFLPRITEVITQIKHKHGDRVVWETLEASAVRAISTRQLKELGSKTPNAKAAAAASKGAASQESKAKAGQRPSRKARKQGKLQGMAKKIKAKLRRDESQALKRGQEAAMARANEFQEGWLRGVNRKLLKTG